MQKNNNQIISILIILLVLALGVSVWKVYKKNSTSWTNNTVVENSNEQTINDDQGLINYTNNIIGISFKYPKSFGPVNITLDSMDGIGYVVRGDIGPFNKFPYPFSFNTATADYIAGDSEIPAGLVKHDPCGQRDTSCEEVVLKDGTSVFLSTRLDNPELEFNRYILHIPLLGSNYTYLTITSANHSTLTDLFPTIDVFIPTSASYEVISAGSGWPEDWIMWPELLEDVAVTKISQSFSLPSYVIVLPNTSRALLPDMNVRCVGDSEISTCVVGSDPVVNAAFDAWADTY